MFWKLLRGGKIFCWGSTKACRTQKYADVKILLVSLLVEDSRVCSVHIIIISFQVTFLLVPDLTLPCEFAVCRTCNPTPGDYALNISAQSQTTANL